jgi:hypothetical protein
MAMKLFSLSIINQAAVFTAKGELSYKLKLTPSLFPDTSTLGSRLDVTYTLKYIILAVC